MTVRSLAVTIGEQQERGVAAFEYRESRARLIRRIEAGETPTVCKDCGTELDVDAPSHSPRCRYYAVAPLVEVKSETTHTKAGGLSAAEMQRRHQEHLDARPSTTRCAFDGCGFHFEGTLAECRDAFEQHRREEHPNVKTSRGAAGRERERMQAEAELRAQQRALHALDEAEVEVEVEAEAEQRRQELTAVATIEPPGHGNQRWTREQMIAAIHRFVAEHGRPPIAKETLGNRALPSVPSVKREFGKWSDLIAACGFERPTRGRRRATPLARTTQDSSDERAVDPTAEEGPRSPTPPVGRADEQQPALGARSQAATADGSGAAGDAQPAADPEDVVAEVLGEVECELRRAMLANAPQHSPHEGWALIREELDELWLHVRMDTGRGQAARVEAIQVAAMALRYVHDLSEAAA